MLSFKQTVNEILPIEKKDKIELARVLGWQGIVKKDYLKSGDSCAFIGPDSILPKIEYFSFMEKHSYRIKKIKLGGVRSDGILLNKADFKLITGKDLDEFNIDDSLDQVLGIEKYSKTESASVSFRNMKTNNFPNFLVKTDEENLESHPDLIKEMYGIPVYVSIKLDGTSTTIYNYRGKIGFCSRTKEIEIKEDDASWWSEYFKSSYIKEIINKNTNLLNFNFAVQGELMGPSIQKNTLGLDKYELFLYNLFDIEGHYYRDIQELLLISKDLFLRPVPIIEKFVFDFKSVDELRDYAEDPVGKTRTGNISPYALEMLSRLKVHEGIVIRPIKEQYSTTLKNRMSFKVINSNYKD